MEPLIKEILHKEKEDISSHYLSQFNPASTDSLGIGIILTQKLKQQNFRELLECLIRIANNAELDSIPRQAALARFFQLIVNAPVSNSNKDRRNVEFLNDLLLRSVGALDELINIKTGFEEYIQKLFSRAMLFLNTHLNITSIVYTLGKLTRTHRNLVNGNIAISELTEEDLEIIQNQSTRSVPDIFGRLVKGCELASKHAVNESDSLRIVIFNTLYYLLESRMNDQPTLMEHLENNLKKYLDLFTEKQKEILKREYTRLCDLFKRDKSKALLDLFSPIRTNLPVTPAQTKTDVSIPPLTEHTLSPIEECIRWIRKQVVAAKRVDTRLLADNMRKVIKKGQEDKVCDELCELIKQEEHNSNTRLMWRLVMKASNEAHLFRFKENKDLLNDTVSEFVNQCDLAKGQPKYHEVKDTRSKVKFEEIKEIKPAKRVKTQEKQPEPKALAARETPKKKEKEEAKESLEYIDITNTSQIPDLPSRIQNLSSTIERILPSISATEEDDKSVQEFLQRIEAISRKLLGDCKFVIFGSAFAGIWTQGSEIDMTVLTSGTDQDEALQRIMSNLESDLECNKCFSSRVHYLQIITRSPRLITVNLSINNTGGIQTSEFLRKICSIDSRAPKLIKIVKAWASAKNIKDKGMYPSGFTYTLLVIHFLQFQKPPVLPTLSELDKNHEWRSKNNLPVGQLAILFFYHYGVEFIKSNLLCDLQDGKLKEGKRNSLFPVKHPITGVLQGSSLKKNSTLATQVINEMRSAYNSLLSSSNISALVNN